MTVAHRLPSDEWLSQSGAAEHLKVTDRTIRDLEARGLLTGFRIRGTRSVRYRISDLDALLLSADEGGDNSDTAA